VNHAARRRSPASARALACGVAALVLAALGGCGQGRGGSTVRAAPGAAPGIAPASPRPVGGFGRRVVGQ